MYKGWIDAMPEDKEHLEELGVQLGEYDEEQGTFENCTVDENAMNRIDPFWGIYFWGLKVTTDV